HGVYRGASALRQYLREAFPNLAPPPEELPPFAPSSAPPHAKPANITLRPQRLRRPSEEVPPPELSVREMSEHELEPSWSPPPADVRSPAPVPVPAIAPPPPLMVPPMPNDPWNDDEDLPTERPP